MPTCLLFLGLASCALSHLVSFDNPTAAPTAACKNGTTPCVYAQGKQQCCTPGEACVPGVGCRCEGPACWGLKTAPNDPTPAPTAACKNGTTPCVYAQGKQQCCTPGEACVPGVGCRCAAPACWGLKKEAPNDPTPAPTAACKNGTEVCAYAPGKQQCCTPGEACVPGVGCRCDKPACWGLKNPANDPTPAPTAACKNGTEVCAYAPGKQQCCTPGETCVPNVGCRCNDPICFGVRHASPTPCPPDRIECDVSPGKVLCCEPGTMCIPGHGCHCQTPDCQTPPTPRVFDPTENVTAPTPGVFGNPPEDCKFGTFIEGPTKNDSLTVVIVTFNLQGWTQHPHNTPRQAQVLKAYNADFIATQEDRYGWDMQKHLGEGVYCFVGETREGRSCNPTCPTKVPASKNGGDGEHTFIYYKCKEWQILETATYYMGTFADDGFPRVYTNARFQNLETLQQIWVTSTHFPKKHAVPGQKVCIQDLVPMGDPWRGNSIMLADFNIIEETGPSPLYKPFKDNRFIFDSYDACPQCRQCHHGYDKHFATFNGRDLWCDTRYPELSDHFPIIGTYDL